MACPMSDEERRRLRALHGKGLGRSAIAAEQGRSAGTVTKLAAELGLSFDRAPTTAAKVADAAAQRAQLNLDYLADAQRLRQQIWEPHEYRDHGGKDFIEAIWTQAEPTPADKLKLTPFSATSSNPLQDAALFGPLAKLVHYTPGADRAVILGRTVWLIGANDVRAQGNLQGLTACLAYVDEAALVPQGFWTMLLSRLSVPGARLIATTNPDGPAHWLRKDFLLRAGELDLAHWHFTLDDNPSLDPTYVRSLKAEYVGLWHRRFILGEWCLA